MNAQPQPHQPQPPLPHQPLQTDERFALALDERDPLRRCRDLFVIPPASAAVAGKADAALDPSVDPAAPSVYLTGNSLGCMPRAVPAAIQRELEDWQALGVEGHLHGRRPWFSYHELARQSAARLVGALPGEVVCMNSLTVNLHLLMISFYRPTADRYRIMIEDSAFPSDSYAVASQARLHAARAGFNPDDAIVRLRPRAGEATLRTPDILEAIDRHGPSLALVMLSGVNYLTGQWFDMPAITRAGKRAGAAVGWDLAHAAGNVPLSLHDWNADFAAWCTYKFLNSGPGAVAGAFVHERNAADRSLPQLAGWWGNDPATRFRMEPGFVPVPTADRWQLSNPPVLALTPVVESLAIFDRVGMPALRAKSLALTAYLEFLIDRLNADSPSGPAIDVLTPRDPEQRGCALSLVVRHNPRQALASLQRRGVICDFREPNVIRAAPVPLYNSFHDVWRFAHALAHVQ
ncbi:MAG: kynureninase [Phycisphaeraceae bacterium]|nr:kynureninase [Phycisphaeraceae bacterium]